MRISGLWWLSSGESNRPLTPILLKSIAIHLPFLSRYFCKSMPSFWQKVVYTPPICITIRLPFVSRYFCRSIRVRGRWNTPKMSEWNLLGRSDSDRKPEIRDCDRMALGHQKNTLLTFSWLISEDCWLVMTFPSDRSIVSTFLGGTKTLRSLTKERKT